jgi:Flp pilus assembly protein TadG
MKVDVSSPRPGTLLARAAKLALRMRADEGGSLVEFAILAPLLFILVAMAGSFTLAFYNLQQLGTATAAAVDLVAAQQGVTTDPCETAQNLIQGNTSTSVPGLLPGFNTANLNYRLAITTTGSSPTTTYYPSSSGWTAGSSTFTCSAAGASGSAPMLANQAVTLTVQYTYTWLPIPTFQPFGTLTPSTPLTTSETAMAD